MEKRKKRRKTTFFSGRPGGPKNGHFSEKPAKTAFFCHFSSLDAAEGGVTVSAIFVLKLINELFFDVKCHLSCFTYEKGHTFFQKSGFPKTIWQIDFL